MNNLLTSETLIPVESSHVAPFPFQTKIRSNTLPVKTEFILFSSSLVRPSKWRRKNSLELKRNELYRLNVSCLQQKPRATSSATAEQRVVAEDHAAKGSDKKVNSASAVLAQEEAAFRIAEVCDSEVTSIGSSKVVRLSEAQFAEESNCEESRQIKQGEEVQVAEGYTMNQFCDKIIEVFMNEKPQSRYWRRLLIFRDEWKKYRESFYNRCQGRVDSENDAVMKRKLIKLKRKVKKIDDEMEAHTELLKEIQDNPTDLNAVVARRRLDFSGAFFQHLNLLSDTCDSLEDRDAMSRLGAKCLSAVRVYDNALEDVQMFESAQSKFDDILNSHSLEAACEKMKSMAKAKELDSSLILLINKAWASAKESSTMTNEAKNIMYHLYKATKSSLRSIAPKEIKLLKYLLNIVDPEERFSALATAFCPGDEHEIKDTNMIYSTPNELHKWIKIMLDAYNMNKEETDLREAKQMMDPVVVQRLLILKETIEQEYMKQQAEEEEPETTEE